MEGGRIHDGKVVGPKLKQGKVKLFAHPPLRIDFKDAFITMAIGAEI